jgi:hypothetical protein
MPKDQFELPNGRIVLRIYGVRHPGPGSQYLNGVRMGLVKEDSAIAIAYHNQKALFAQVLAREIEKEGVSFDALVFPPSSRDDIDVYRLAILDRMPARVLSGFTRKGKVKAGDRETTLADMIEEFDYAANGDERDIGSLLILDESVADGKTAAALLEHLRRNGLPDEARVVLALWTVVKS